MATFNSPGVYVIDECISIATPQFPKKWSRKSKISNIFDMGLSNYQIFTSNPPPDYIILSNISNCNSRERRLEKLF